MPRNVVVLSPPSGRMRELCDQFERCIAHHGSVCVCETCDSLIKKLKSGELFDLVAVDFENGDGDVDGTAVFKAVRAVDDEIPLIAVADEGDVDLAHRAVSAGATDFLVMGENLADRVETLLGKVSNLLNLIRRNRVLDEHNQMLREEVEDRFRIVGESPEILHVIEQIRRVAAVPRPVLIVGERGTGKELVARAIHEASGKAKKPMIVINCAAFPDTLLESELFGHEKGAFTGADRLAYGKFEQAAGGTLFLDEIGNMTLAFQQKILRVVEYGTFTRIGGTAEVKTDARIIAATNVDLREKMEAGEFLRDLYDRLSFEVIRVPALRERPGDIEVLARYFLGRFMKEIPAFRGKRLAPSALEALLKYKFPGNVRELKNIIERAAYRDTTNEITPGDIGMLSARERSSGGGGGSFVERVESFKCGLITSALESCDGNKAAAARKLGLSYHKLRYYLSKRDEGQ